MGIILRIFPFLQIVPGPINGRLVKTLETITDFENHVINSRQTILVDFLQLFLNPTLNHFFNDRINLVQRLAYARAGHDILYRFFDTKRIPNPLIYHIHNFIRKSICVFLQLDRIDSPNLFTENRSVPTHEVDMYLVRAVIVIIRQTT